jgi:hypothetical protein
MGRIKCVKMHCPICQIIGTAQLFLNKKSEIKYARIRHYKGLNEFKKPQFEYHKIEDPKTLKTLLKTQDFQFPSATGQSGQGQTITLKQLHEQNSKIQPLNPKNKCLGSLARWGTALVRRRSRDQSPPEAPLKRSKRPS